MTEGQSSPLPYSTGVQTRLSNERRVEKTGSDKSGRGDSADFARRNPAALASPPLFGVPRDRKRHRSVGAAAIGVRGQPCGDNVIHRILNARDGLASLVVELVLSVGGYLASR
jgi:hypothetical protein